MTKYEELGFKNRKAYLEDLSDNSGIDVSIIESLADMLGSNEDFDGLLTSLDDIQAGDNGIHGGYDGE